MQKMFPGTPNEIGGAFDTDIKKSWVKFFISCKSEVSHKSLVLRTYLMVSYIQEYSRIIEYDKTFA